MRDATAKGDHRAASRAPRVALESARSPMGPTNPTGLTATASVPREARQKEVAIICARSALITPHELSVGSPKGAVTFSPRDDEPASLR